MEPISTAIVLFATGLVTRAPLPTQYPSPRSGGPQGITTIYTPLEKALPPSTECLIAESQIPVPMDVKENLALELRSYELLPQEWDGPDSVIPSDVTIESAIQFISKIPSGLPLPKPMISRNGELGLYWDTENAYADISFENGNSASLFLHKKTGLAEETFVDDILVANLADDWYWNNLSELHDKLQTAA